MDDPVTLQKPFDQYPPLPVSAVPEPKVGTSFEVLVLTAEERKRARYGPAPVTPYPTRPISVPCPGPRCLTRIPPGKPSGLCFYCERNP